MDIQKEREEFEKLPEIAKRLNVATYSEDLGFYHAAALNSGHTVAYVQGAWMAWQAKSQAVPEGFVLVPHDQFESLSMFKDLYKRAIISARKRKDQLNWAHVAGLGVGSGRAVELCKMLNIDPYATNMHEVIKPQEQSHE